jgi:hypothetical protein
MNAAAPTLWQRLCHTRLRDALRGRFDASLDWRLVVADAELPREIGDVLARVVRQTHLWRREKVAVAAELVAHFQDGLESGRVPDELVTSFGDVGQAALLIRRAKIRNRSPLWHILHYGVWGVIALVCAYIVLSLWTLMTRPSITTDFLSVLNERARAVSEQERAWPLYRDAILEMGLRLQTDENVTPYVIGGPEDLGDEESTSTQAFLRDHAPSISKLREAALRPGLGFVAATSHAGYSENDRKLFSVSVTPDEIETEKQRTLEDRWLISTTLPHLHVLAYGGSLLASDARRAAVEGDTARALSDIEAMLGISRHCQETPFLRSLLYAAQVQQEAQAAIRQILTQQSELWSDGNLRDLAHVVSKSRIDWRQGFEGERAGFLDCMQRIYTDDGNGDGQLAFRVNGRQNFFELLNSVTHGPSGHVSTLENDSLAMFVLPAANMVVASRKEMTDTYQTFSQDALVMLDKPLWELESNSLFDDEIRSLENEPLSRIRYLFIHLLLPAYDGLRINVATDQGKRDGTLIGIALELYHRKHGTWPRLLAELSPRWLPQLPVDLINGGPLGYRILGGRPIVYSLGVDGDDDDGRLPEGCEGDATKYPVSAPFELPDEATDPMRDQYDGDWVIWTTRTAE